MDDAKAGKDFQKRSEMAIRAGTPPPLEGHAGVDGDRPTDAEAEAAVRPPSPASRGLPPEGEDPGWR